MLDIFIGCSLKISYTSYICSCRECDALKVILYNGFHLDDFNDLSTFVSEEQKYDVKGIMVVYNTTYEIYPIAITSAETGNPYDLNGDGKVSAGDIQIIINEMKKAAEDQDLKYDLNGDGKITPSDGSIIMRYLYESRNYAASQGEVVPYSYQDYCVKLK